jgi:hypothetical protein
VLARANRFRASHNARPLQTRADIAITGDNYTTRSPKKSSDFTAGIDESGMIIGLVGDVLSFATLETTCHATP